MTPTPSTLSAQHTAGSLTFGSWNINARSGATVPSHLEFLRQAGVDAVALQEVTEPYYQALARSVGEQNVAYSLAVQPPEPGAAKNRRLGCAIVVFRSDLAITETHLIQTAVCPERSLVARLRLGGHDITVGSFHSPNGSQWGRNKALWFHDITSWVSRQTGPTLFGIDANTPRNAALPDNDPGKWWNEDSHAAVGNAARALVGDQPDHGMRDVWRRLNPDATSFPASFNRDNRRAKRPELDCRYDFIFASPHFDATACHYYFDEVTRSVQPLSDHALVVAVTQLGAEPRSAQAPRTEEIPLNRTPAPTTVFATEPVLNHVNDGPIPSAEAYERAFRELLQGSSEGYRRMLQANLRAPGHAINPQELALAAGYRSLAAANLQYGKLAGRVGNELGYKPKRLSLQGKECKTFAIADWRRGQWVLHQNVATALSRLGL